MIPSNNEIATAGVGLSAGAGAALMSEPFGLGVGVIGLGAILLAIERDRGSKIDEESEDDEVATDGGTTRRGTPEEAAPEQPTVLNVEIVGDRMLASAERGDISLVVEAPAGTSEDELEAVLDEVPAKIERTADLFTGGDR
ncbi:hypothetical protein [Halorubrum ezzemoulense]|nr:hypothetical protein [Halorubrum ezzemoulense]